MVQKPMSVARAEFYAALISLINNSGLPGFVLEPILRDAHNEVLRQDNEQLKQDQEAYRIALENESNESDVDTESPDDTESV